MTPTTVFLSLGSNLGDSVKCLEQAVACIGQCGINVTRLSSVYRTEPQEDTRQPWFFNQVLRVETTLAPHAFLKVLQEVENSLGRRRGTRRFGPRTIDIDILLYGNTLINDPDLTVPHPRMCERAFVLVPLVEIAPDLRIPSAGTASNTLKQLKFTLDGDKIWQKL